MNRIIIMIRLLREIHLHHLASVGGYAFELILANDRACLALLNGKYDAVEQYADWARCAYTRMEIPENATLAADLAAIATEAITIAAEETQSAA